MRSDFRFVMHPADEKEFVSLILSEPGVALVDGPKWDQASPPICSDVSQAGDYLMIWNRSETANLKGKRYELNGKQWWYCANEQLTIQFLRSDKSRDKRVLLEGRLAVNTTDAAKTVRAPAVAESIERRFKNLRKALRKTYVNSILIWQNPTLPRSKTNPGKPAPSVWIGPHALRWLEEAPRERWVQQFRESIVRGYIVDLIPADDA